MEDLTVFAMIRIPTYLDGDHLHDRVGVIYGNFPQNPSINFEVYYGGCARLYWNKGEIDLRTDKNKYGINLIDGKLCAITNKCGKSIFFSTKPIATTTTIPNQNLKSNPSKVNSVNSNLIIKQHNDDTGVQQRWKQIKRFKWSK